MNIVNGQTASECEWKWQASLREKNAFCGGTLVHKRWVFTAAHCIGKSTTKTLKVVLGDHDKDTVGKNESKLSVRRIVVHPKYDSDSMVYDYALLELESEATLNDCIGTACIPQKNDNPMPADVDCFITGWGTLQQNGNQPRYLQEASVKTLTNKACNENYDGAIKDTMICAQGRNSDGAVTDACQGDSGGPLVCMRGKKFYLEGATSWGKGCADKDHPGIWARLTTVFDWYNSWITKGKAP